MLKVYRDEQANSAVIESTADGTLGMYFNNELKAVGNGDGTCSVCNEPKSTDTTDFFELAGVAFSDFADAQGVALGASEVAVCDALNAIFHNTGGAQVSAPVITSATTVDVASGDQLNYTLEATGAVEFEWSNLPPGVTVSSSNRRKLVGALPAGVGSYAVTVTAINYYGSVTETITFNSISTYANTKSIDFANLDYMGANASLLDSILGRTGNGGGSGDAWTIHLWFKGGSNSSGGQTIFYFGDSDVDNGGHFTLRFLGNNDTLRFQYGSLYNYLRWDGPTNLLPSGTWKHVMLTYDGGTTGSSSGSINDYYGRFTIYVDGVDVTSGGSWSNGNYGYSGGVDANNLRVGRYKSGSNYLRDCRVDELAVWAGSEAARIADIYNSGTPHDLSLLASPPDHWWRMGDGDTYPTIQDNVGTAHFVMYNMTAADIVTDAP